MKKKFAKQKYKPLSAATTEEKREAFRLAGLWTSAEVEGRTEVGAFSEQNLGVAAVEYFPLKAYQTLSDPDCKWKWKDGTKLSTLMINVIRSEMAHVLRDHILDGEPLVKANSEYEHADAEEDGFDDANEAVDIDPADRQNGFQVKSDMELLEELMQRELRRDKGYKIAKAAAKGDAVLEKYVEVVFGGASTDREVSKKMKRTLAELQELQEKLIARIRETI